uniref:Retrovirus-related Pol polyprotein from transposon TNT 1-94 n=1 Tax=Cajanus cajan TaxID=3821 RepID=A0A151T8B7_CAJCA|nr:Retrovirus-related Pol polyprotein from transposon TNT 1-94 [Cajanus cajan]
MQTKTSFSQVASPVFDGKNYDLWTVRMKSYLEDLDLWKVVEEDYEVPQLPRRKKNTKAKVRSCLFVGVSSTIFIGIMTLKIEKEIWDYLKEEYEGDERILSKQVLNLMREFKLQRMKESETIKEYSDKLLTIVNKVRLLGIGFATSSENIAKIQNKGKGKKKNYPPCEHCGRMGHQPFKCWKRPNAKCNKCNQLRHEDAFCRSKFQLHEANAQVVEKDEEDRIFYVTCFSARSNMIWWLIDSGFTNHMIYSNTLFKDLKPTKVTKVRIGNGDYISMNGKGTIAISISSGTKTILEVLHVPDIDKNLLSVGQLIEKGFKVSFKYQHCHIYETIGQELIRVKMRGKSFLFDPTKEEQVAYYTQVSPTELWYKRLDHCHLQRMLNLKKKDMTSGLPVLSDRLPNCNACQFGKQNKVIA